MAGYDDRDGFIWMDGKLVDWRSANVHILTHAMHYASSVFEGERCYNGKIFKSTEHSQRLLKSGELLDMPIPYTVEEINAAKDQVLAANGLTDAYVRAVAFRGAGDEMGVASLGNPVRLAIACWTWGAYYGDAKFKGAIHPDLAVTIIIAGHAALLTFPNVAQLCGECGRKLRKIWASLSVASWKVNKADVTSPGTEGGPSGICG